MMTTKWNNPCHSGFHSFLLLLSARNVKEHYDAEVVPSNQGLSS